MTIIDSNELPEDAELKADICIVGAGAAGITIASELDSGSQTVCLLESGGQHLQEDVQALYDLDNLGHPIRENFMARVRYFGGSCNLWAGRAMKLSPMDFKPRSWVPHSGWPVSSEELDRYFEGAEQILRLPSFAKFQDVGAVPGIGEKESKLFDGRDLCPTVALWGTKPLRFGRVYRKALKRSSNIRVYLNGNATEIRTDESGQHVEAVTAKTMQGKQFTVKARIFVLACGGLENARLLLVNELGNQHDNVGRYYLDHPRVLFGRVRLNKPARLPYLLGLPQADGKVQLGIGLSERIQREEGLLNSYLSFEPQLSQFAEAQYGRTINVMKVLLRRGHAGGRLQFRASMTDVREMIYLLTPKEILPHFLYRYYAMLKRLMRRTVSASHLTVINYCEQAPDPESRVTLGEERDVLGMPKLRLNWQLGDEGLSTIRRLHELVGERLESTGIGTLESSFAESDPLPFTDASHHIGTARMSSDPKRGVVDSDCKVHGVGNLFVAGSAVFPTAGYANPTFTVVALALRLSDHLRHRK